MKKVLLLIAGIICLSLSSQAQFRIGPKVNIGLTQFRPNDIAGEFASSSTGIAWGGGAQVDWRFGRMGLVGELTYSRRSLKSKIQNQDFNFSAGSCTGCDSETTIDVNSLDVPILLRYYFRGKESGAFLTSGIQMGFNLSGEYTSDIIVNGELIEEYSTVRDLLIGSTRTDEYKSSDFGFVLGGGYFIETATGIINLELRYRLGASEQYTNGDPVISNRANYRTGELSLNAAYVFSLGGGW